MAEAKGKKTRKSKKEAAGKTCWILCPVYFDVSSFKRLRTELLSVLEEAGSQNKHAAVGKVRFVIVDDTANLDTEIPTLSEFADVSIISVPFNLGHQQAIVYGLRALQEDDLQEEVCDDDIILTLDSDGEDQPEDVPRLLQTLWETTPEQKTIVLAQRTKRQESPSYKALYFCFRIMFQLLTGTIVRSGNFAMYYGTVVKNTLCHPYFDMCYSSSLLNIGLPVRLVPCARGKRYHGKSHMNYLRLIMHGFRMLMPFMDRIAVRALIIFFCMFGLGVVAIISLTVAKTLASWTVPGWTTYSILLVLIISVVALGNFLVLFSMVAHAKANTLKSIQQWKDSKLARQQTSKLSR